MHPCAPDLPSEIAKMQNTYEEAEILGTVVCLRLSPARRWRWIWPVPRMLPGELFAGVEPAAAFAYIVPWD